MILWVSIRTQYNKENTEKHRPSCSNKTWLRFSQQKSVTGNTRRSFSLLYRFDSICRLNAASYPQMKPYLMAKGEFFVLFILLAECFFNHISFSFDWKKKDKGENRHDYSIHFSGRRHTIVLWKNSCCLVLMLFTLKYIYSYYVENILNKFSLHFDGSF